VKGALSEAKGWGVGEELYGGGGGPERGTAFEM